MERGLSRGVIRRRCHETRTMRLTSEWICIRPWNFRAKCLLFCSVCLCVCVCGVFLGVEELNTRNARIKVDGIMKRGK